MVLSENASRVSSIELQWRTVEWDFRISLRLIIILSIRLFYVRCDAIDILSYSPVFSRILSISAKQFLRGAWKFYANLMFAKIVHAIAMINLKLAFPLSSLIAYAHKRYLFINTIKSVWFFFCLHFCMLALDFHFWPSGCLLARLAGWPGIRLTKVIVHSKMKDFLLVLNNAMIFLFWDNNFVLYVWRTYLYVNVINEGEYDWHTIFPSLPFPSLIPFRAGGEGNTFTPLRNY